MSAPLPPPEPPVGVPGPTYVANGGNVWRRAMKTWELLDPQTAPKLLAAFLVDASDTSDWFHPRAAELAAELSRAIAKAGAYAQRKAA